MKRVWMVLLLLVAVAVPAAMHAQVSVYGEFSASDLKGGPQGDYLWGGTAGVLFDGPTMFHHMLLSGDLQGRFVRKNGESLNGATVGPRFTIPVKRLKLSPYAEFMVGFARYNDSHSLVSTDNTFQVNMGVARQVSPRLDIVADYSYSQFGVNNGEFNPKTYSAGLVYHITKR